MSKDAMQRTTPWTESTQSKSPGKTTAGSQRILFTPLKSGLSSAANGADFRTAGTSERTSL